MTDLKSLSKNEIILISLAFILSGLLIYKLPESELIVSTTQHSLKTAIHSKFNYYFHLTSFGSVASDLLGNHVLVLFGLLGFTLVFSNYGILPLHSFIISSSLYALIVNIFAADFTILGPLSFLPYIYLSIANSTLLRPSSLVLLICLIVLSWLLLYSLAIPTILFAILLFILVEPTERSSLVSGVITISIFSIILLMLLSPALPWPDYPPNARLTTLTRASPWMARPLIGNDIPFPTLDRATLVSHYNYLLLPLAVLILLSSFLCLKNVLSKKIWLTCTVCFLCVYFDFKLNEQLAQIFPLQSLPRLIPELNLIPLAPLFLCLTLIGLFVLLYLSRVRSSFSPIFILLLLIAFTCFNNQKSESLVLADVPESWSQSPSRFVSNFFSPAVLKTAKLDSKSFRPNKNNIIATSSNQTDVDVEALCDKDLQTRWSNMASQQNGSEWIMFSFKVHQKLLGIELKTGPYQTDFPRGLRVKVGASCEPQALNEILYYPSWQGSLKFTPNGFPYFNPQSDVKLFFPDEFDVGCVKIEQTAKTDFFDWSIAELRVIKKDKEKIEHAN